MEKNYREMQERNVELTKKVMKKMGIEHIGEKDRDDSIIVINANLQNKIDLNIFFSERKIRIQATFILGCGKPVGYPLVLMLLGKEFYNKAFATPRFDFRDGELSLEYAFCTHSSLEDSEELLLQDIEVYLQSAVIPAIHIYEEVDDYLHGILDNKEKEAYIDLFEHLIKYLRGEFVRGYEWEYPSDSVEDLMLKRLLKKRGLMGDEEETGDSDEKKETLVEQEFEEVLGSLPENLQHLLGVLDDEDGNDDDNGNDVEDEE